MECVLFPVDINQASEANGYRIYKVFRSHCHWQIHVEPPFALSHNMNMTSKYNDDELTHVNCKSLNTQLLPERISAYCPTEI